MDFLNPTTPDWSRQNFVLSGRARDYRFYSVPGTLSIKSVLDGSGIWTTSEGRFAVGEETYLIVNNGQVYDIEISADEPVHTFCAFFAPGFVERVSADLAGGSPDDGHQAGSLEFMERLNPHDDLVTPALSSLRWAVLTVEPETVEVDEAFLDLALALSCWRRKTRFERERLTFAKVSTREELHKRLARARTAVLAELGRRWSLETMASEAFLSPFHFHRCFHAAFGAAPSEFLRRVRIERASKLIEKRKMGVTEAAFEVGYASPTSFAAAFRRVKGRSPSGFEN